jgi:hypothetical protein
MRSKEITPQPKKNKKKVLTKQSFCAIIKIQRTKGNDKDEI